MSNEAITPLRRNERSIASEAQLDIATVLSFAAGVARRLPFYVPLLLLLSILIGSIWLLSYLWTPPIFVARATIGPPNPSPVSSMMSSMGGSQIGNSAARRLLGGGGGTSSDPFQEYQQLMLSPRLAVELAQKDNFLQTIFEASWDSAGKRWKPRGSLHAFSSAINRFLNRPVLDHPDVDSLVSYLQTHLQFAQAQDAGKTQVASLSGGNSPYLTVSFQSNTPERAEAYLDTILRRADDIIRQQHMRDVDARIQYISNELARITLSEQKEALIDTMASQEELKVMMVADQRFSYVLVSMPYASPTPISPMSPFTALIFSFVASTVAWIFLVAAASYSGVLKRWIDVFRWPNRKAPAGAALMPLAR
ncbi:MAG: hypothetical protein WDM86_15715 [Rhizomicrobium sp.]